MAHFAQLDDEGRVIRVSVVRDEDALDTNGLESEAVGVSHLKSVHGSTTRWVQASYNARIRRRFPGVGMIYDATHDAFIDPQPSPECVLNTNSLEWDCPEESLT